MGTLTVNATNGQTVAAGASYTVSYPAGKSAADYLATGAKITTSDGSIYSATVSLGGSGITITNPTGRAIASGGFDYLDLDNAGIVARFNSLGEGDVLLGPKNTEASLVSSENNLLTGGNILSSGGEDVLSPALSFIGVQSSHPFMNGLISNIRELQGADANEKHLSSLEAALRPLVASTAWQKIRELWVPTGNTLTAALVKIKAALIAAGTENRSLINVNFVSGDYSPTVGITGDGSSKYLYSQCTPNNALRTSADAAACTVKNYGFAAYPTNPVHSAAGYLLGAGLQGSNYLNLGGFGDAAGSDVLGLTAVKRGVNTLVPTGHRVRMQFVQNYNNLMQAGTGGLVEAEIAATETTVSQDKISCLS